jgi:hypothetical protein
MGSGRLTTGATAVSLTAAGTVIELRLLTYAGTNKRGVIVYVYAVNGNTDELGSYEDGEYGNYYNATD